MNRKTIRIETRRKAKQGTKAKAPALRSKLTAFGTLVASATLAGIASPAAASQMDDPRLRVIHEALQPRWSVFGTAFPAAALQQAPGAAQAPTFRLNIPGGPLRDVAAALERETGMRVSLQIESIGVIDSPGVTGNVTFEQALKAIVEGTNVTYRQTAPNVAVLDVPSITESVSVTGAVVPELASPKYNAPLRDIPQTIEVIPRAAMEAQGVTTLSEALRNVPGITLQAGEGGGASSTAGDMFNMRGFNASNSLFVDNVRDDGLVSRDVFNLEQVEVFMGPTGSDVGRGSAAGYVNMQTKSPHLPNATSATLAVGTASQRRAALDVNRAIGNGDGWLGKSAVRLNVLWQDSGVPGRDEVENESKGFAPSLALGLGTPTRLIASAQILRQDNLPDYGIPGAAWKETQLTPTTVQAPNDISPSNYYGSVDYDYDRARQNSTTVRLEHEVNSRWTLSNQTRYNKTEREAIISTIQNVAAYVPETDLVTIARQGNARENTIVSNQTTLTGRVVTGRLEHNISSGIEFLHEAQFVPTLGGFGTRTPANVNVYNPNPRDPVTDIAVAPTGAFTDGRTNTAALYAFDSVSLGSRIQVNGGLRFERYDTKFRSVDATNTTTVDESASDGLLSGKAGIVFRARPNGNVYVSYGTTVTPPGGANFALSSAPNNQNNPNVKPQEASNVEVGTKWEVADGRLLLNGAVFHTINKNVLFTVDAAAVPPVYNQDDEQRVDGVALGATGQMTPDWQVLATFGYLDSESLTQNTTNSGRRLTLSPKYSGSIWSTYRLPKGWTVGGGIRATSEWFINTANTIGVPGYHIVDGLVEYAVNQHLTLRLNVYNLTDTLYIRNVNNNGGRYNPGYPRTAQLTSAIAF